MDIQDILTPGGITAIPLAPAQVKGAINLRGRIVTVIDVRVCLGMPPYGDGTNTGIGVTVEYDHELYTLLVDRIGDVMGFPDEIFEPNVSTLNPKWQKFSHGIHRLENHFLVGLDAPSLLEQ